MLSSHEIRKGLRQHMTGPTAKGQWLYVTFITLAILRRVYYTGFPDPSRPPPAVTSLEGAVSFGSLTVGRHSLFSLTSLSNWSAQKL